MTRQVWLADALQDAGLDVVQYVGWETRGGFTFHPGGLVIHHTGPWKTVKGMVDLCVNGRAGLPGPLCQVVLDPAGTCHVIAAGRANHAGPGSWKGLTGNGTVLGIEAIHDGQPTTPWPAAQLAAYKQAAATIIRGLGVGPEMVCGHREWAPLRKVDPAGINLDVFRADVAALLAPPKEVKPMSNAPFASMLVHPAGGYLEIGEDGGVFAWGGAPFFGSLGDVHLNQPIVAAAWAPDHMGYYLLGRDGGIFAFGSARHQGNALWAGP